MTQLNTANRLKGLSQGGDGGRLNGECGGRPKRESTGPSYRESGDYLQIHEDLLEAAYLFGRDSLGAAQCLEEVLEGWGGEVGSREWYPIAVYLEMLRALVERFYAGTVERLAELGRFLGGFLLHDRERDPAEPEWTFPYLLRPLHRSLYSSGELLTRLAEDGRSWEIRLRGAPFYAAEDLAVCAGLYAEAARLMGYHATAPCYRIEEGQGVCFQLEWSATEDPEACGDSQSGISYPVIPLVVEDHTSEFAIGVG